jgi:hypothetical protein
MVHALIALALAVGPALVEWEPPAMQALRQQVAQEAERLKQQLASAESGADYTRLLHRKLTTDCSLAPLVLQEDAAAFVAAAAAGREPPDLLRLLRVEYGPEPVHSEWACAGGREKGVARIAAALRAWTTSAGASAMLVDTCMLASAPGESAPCIRWSCVSGSSDAAQSGETVSVPMWYEPCLEARDLDWPLSPTGIEIRWDTKGASVWAAGKTLHSESWGPAPAFNNPNDLYAVFDALRARASADHEVKAGKGEDIAGADDVVVRRLVRTDRSVVRTETWTFQGDRLQEWRIDQPSLRLVHRSPHAFEIKQQVEGQDSGPPLVLTPQSVLAHPSEGLRCTIAFRAPQPGRDALPDGAGPGSVVPDRVRLESGGRLVAMSSVLACMSAEGADGRMQAQRVAQVWQSAAAAAASERLHDMSLAEAACAAGDLAATRAALARARARNHADGVPGAWDAANAAVCVRRLEEHGHHGEAEIVANEEWLPMVLAMDAEQRLACAGAALRHGSYALAFVVVNALAQADGGVDALVDREWMLCDEWVTERARRTGAPPPCDGSWVKPDLRALHAVVERALERVADAELRSALRMGGCAALNRVPSAKLSASSQVERSSFGQADAQLAALVDHGIGEFSMRTDGKQPSVVLAHARFRHRVARALAAPVPTDHERARMAELTHTFALAARDATLEELRRRGVPASLALAAAAMSAAEMQRRAPLLGNPFEPALLRMPAREIPSAEEARLVTLAGAGAAGAMRALEAELAVRASSGISFGRRAPGDDPDTQAVAPPPDPLLRFAQQVSAVMVNAAWSALRQWHARE